MKIYNNYNTLNRLHLYNNLDRNNQSEFERTNSFIYTNANNSRTLINDMYIPH